MLAALAWYLREVIQFGFPTVLALDLLGAYFLFSVIALLSVIRNRKYGILSFLACSITLPLSVFFLGKFLSAFVPFYGVSNDSFAYFLRGGFLLGSVALLFAIDPKFFFKFNRWNLIPAILASLAWLFVYIFPETVREWYGTRSEPSELFPDGLLVFSRANPEREIQGILFWIAAVTWGINLVAIRLYSISNKGRS